MRLNKHITSLRLILVTGGVALFAWILLDSRGFRLTSATSRDGECTWRRRWDVFVSGRREDNVWGIFRPHGDQCGYRERREAKDHEQIEHS